MNRYYIVKEYIYYYIYKRKLTKQEFCKILDISTEQWLEIESNSESFDMAKLKQISEYISVPIKFLYIDLDNPDHKPISHILKREEFKNEEFYTRFFFD